MSLPYWPDDDELGESYILRYLALKVAGRIGAVWLGYGFCWLAPANALHPWNERKVIPLSAFRRLIDELDPPKVREATPQAELTTKIPPQSSRPPQLVRKQSA